MEDTYKSQSHFGMFREKPVHEKEVQEAIARKLKCYEPIQFTRVTRIYDERT